MIYENPYEFDIDSNKMLALTNKNVAFMNAIISNDSSYRNTYDGSDVNTASCIIKAAFKSNDINDYNNIYKIVCAIDRENSTHLSASGTKKGCNEGRQIVARVIADIPNLIDRLYAGEAELVNYISSAVPKRNNFSFASKFCTYVSRAIFEDSKRDNYCIYDKVLCNSIPYYAWFFLKENHTSRLKSTIEKEYKSVRNYAGYRDLIDRIRIKNFEITQYLISRENFDHLLWYYYKGTDGRALKGLSLIDNTVHSMVQD